MAGVNFHAATSSCITPGPVRFQNWLQDRGISPVTAWRWRNRGWVRTIDIAGKPYITQAEIAEFERRAIAGEFREVPKAGGAK